MIIVSGDVRGKTLKTELNCSNIYSNNDFCLIPMPKDILRDTTIKSAKPAGKNYRLTDGDGLYIIINTKGGKWWRFDYSFNGNRKTLSLGVYPETSIKTARQNAALARENVANGIDPSNIRKDEKSKNEQSNINKERLASGLPLVNSFADVADRWLKSREHLLMPITINKKKTRIETHAFPLIGGLLINEVKPMDVMAVLDPMIKKGHYVNARNLRAEISSIFDFAIIHGLADADPAWPVRRQIPANKVIHQPAVTDPKLVGKLMNDIDGYKGTFVVCMAFKLAPLLFQRPGEIRQMKWEDINFELREWRPLISKKSDFEFWHIVPLSVQAITILNAIKPVTSKSKFVFPSARGNDNCISRTTINAALKSLGYKGKMCFHGFRTIGSTLLNELGWSADAIERQLSHTSKDHVRAAYNRASYLAERREMMQAWADYLDKLKTDYS